MTRAWTAVRALGVLVVALLLALGPAVGHAVAGAAPAATTTTAAVDHDHDHDQCDECHDRILCGSGKLIPRSAPGTPSPRAACGYPSTAVASTVGRPVPAAVAGHQDHNRRLAALQVFRR